jgi:hypothetical protein
MNELATKYSEIGVRIKEIQKDKENKDLSNEQKDLNSLEESALRVLAFVIKRRLELKGTLVYGLD